MKIPLSINIRPQIKTRVYDQNHVTPVGLSVQAGTRYQGQNVTNLIGTGYLGRGCASNTRGSGDLNGVGVNIRTWCAQHPQGSWLGQIQAAQGKTLCINCDDWNQWDAL